VTIAKTDHCVCRAICGAACQDHIRVVAGAAGKAPDLRRMERCPTMVLPPGARIIDGSVVMRWPGQPGYALPRGSFFSTR
jgi:hypothetical protein